MAGEGDRVEGKKVDGRNNAGRTLLGVPCKGKVACEVDATTGFASSSSGSFSRGAFVVEEAAGLVVLAVALLAANTSGSSASTGSVAT